MRLQVGGRPAEVAVEFRPDAMARAQQALRAFGPEVARLVSATREPFAAAGGRNGSGSRSRPARCPACSTRSARRGSWWWEAPLKTEAGAHAGARRPGGRDRAGRRGPRARRGAGGLRGRAGGGRARATPPDAGPSPHVTDETAHRAGAADPGARGLPGRGHRGLPGPDRVGRAAAPRLPPGRRRGRAPDGPDPRGRSRRRAAPGPAPRGAARPQGSLRLGGPGGLVRHGRPRVLPGRARRDGPHPAGGSRRDHARLA